MEDAKKCAAGGVALSFIDSSTFLYAYLTIRDGSTPRILAMKENAQTILRRVQEGEKTTTSAVHISETANILEKRFPLSKARHVASLLIQSENVEIFPVNKIHYEAALAASERHEVGLNDALAYTLMKERNIDTIYSFDRDFDRLPGVHRLTK